MKHKKDIFGTSRKFISHHKYITGTVLVFAILLSTFLTLRGASPKMSELSFVSGSPFGSGSVVPASCDSSGISLYDHTFHKNEDGTYDVKPCSCVAPQVMTHPTMWYCDYSINGANSSDPAANPATVFGYTPPFTAVVVDPATGRCKPFEINYNNFTYTSIGSYPRSFVANVCVTPQPPQPPAVNLNFQ